MVDISNYEKMQIKIFNAILDFGRPKTTYDLMQQHLKIATIHRHLKEMLDYGEIKVYEETKKGRKKINYGPTFIGITQFYNLDNKIRKNVDEANDGTWANLNENLGLKPRISLFGLFQENLLL